MSSVQLGKPDARGIRMARLHTIGVPIAWTAAAFPLGIALLPLARETTGEELPI